MERIKRIPESELEIMMIIWESDQPVTSAYVMENLPKEKKWAQTTVLNFLARLVDRGFLAFSKQGRVNYYTPLVDEDDYLHQESKSFLEKMHMGSVKNFVAALYDGEAIDEEDLLELKKYVEEVSKKK
ncbi:MAG: BlaI/MecI/CopY family transcriptional regulator [Eubacteriales bacterium]|nr:BlaI/MecI/CopY family transcriptional regulator [Eubacteriales bacterium]